MTPALRVSLVNHRSVLVCAAILFLLACALPALEFRRNETGQDIWWGGQILAFGWLGLFIGQVAWFANPVMIVAALLLFFQRRRICVLCAAVALCLSFDTYSLFAGSIPADEGGVGRLFLTRVREGTYLWQASIGVLAMGALVARAPAVRIASNQPPGISQ